MTLKMSCILYVDDLVMFFETFASENGLKINSDQTKCMVFNTNDISEDVPFHAGIC